MGCPPLSSTHVLRYVLFFLYLHLARKCVLPARAHSAMLRRDGNLLWKGTLKEGLFCDDPQLYYGNWPGIASGLPWTRAKACAQTLNE